MISRRILTPLLVALILLLLVARHASAQAAPWVTVHYPYWEEGVMQPSDIDLTTATDLIYFAAIPQANGGLDTSNLDEPSAVLAAAHTASRPALLSVGGGGNGPLFVSAIQPANAPRLVAAIMKWVKANNFDGVDIDFEPLPQSSSANFKAFIGMLHTQLKAYKNNAVLTGDFTPDLADAKAAFPSHSYFDQVNVMTYDLSGAYPGWVTWYDSCIFTTGSFASTGNPYPSTDLSIRDYLSAGFPSAQLGVGIDTFGYIWTNADQPGQSITSGAKPGDSQTTEMTYRDIMAQLYSSNVYHYDTAAEAPWLGLAASNEFVSYTDPQLCADKTNYVKNLGLGGVMIWDITAQYQNGQNPFLTAIGNVLSQTSNQNLNWPDWVGAYSGNFETAANPASNIVGDVSATISGSGSIVIAAGWDKTPTMFKGVFATNGRFTATVGRRSSPALTLSIQSLGKMVNGITPMMVGSVTDGTTAVPWFAERITYGKSNYFPAPGNYPCVLTGSSTPDGPSGNSSANLTIGATGGVTLKGTLPDGTSFTTKSLIDGDGVIPISIPLYKRTGYLVNILEWTSAPLVTGTLYWQKSPGKSTSYPSGFTGSIVVSGTWPPVTLRHGHL